MPTKGSIFSADFILSGSLYDAFMKTCLQAGLNLSCLHSYNTKYANIVCGKLKQFLLAFLSQGNLIAERIFPSPVQHIKLKKKSLPHNSYNLSPFFCLMPLLPEKLLCILSRKRVQDLLYFGVMSLQCEQDSTCTQTTRNNLQISQILITRKNIYRMKLKSMNNSPASADDKPRSGTALDDQ